MNKYNPKYRAAGTKVQITKASFANIASGNRSIKVFPSSDFVNRINKYIGQVGIITLTFLPSYEVNVTFPDGQTFQVKDSWIEDFIG